MKVRIKPYYSKSFIVEYKAKWWHIWSGLWYVDTRRFCPYYFSMENAKADAEFFLQNHTVLMAKRKQKDKESNEHLNTKTEYMNG